VPPRRPARRQDRLAGHRRDNNPWLVSDSVDISADAQRLVQQLPAIATWDDLAYEIYGRQAIEQGLADADAERTVDHEPAMARVRARLRHAS